MKITIKTAVVSIAFLSCIAGFGQEGVQKVKDYISGGQLVYYTKTSIFVDSNASSITYVNFCANGMYSINYDGSFYVSGDGGWAGGGSNNTNRGTWDVTFYNSAYYLYIKDANGTSNYYPIDFQKLYSGRWKNGNTQYAFVRNKVRCN